MTAPALKPTAPSMLAVYDGSNCIGFVLRRAAGVEAFDVADSSLGLFASEATAASALWRCARKQPIRTD
jgi:hypothetical protein